MQATKVVEDVFLGHVCNAILFFSLTFVVVSMPVSFGLPPVTLDLGPNDKLVKSRDDQESTRGLERVEVEGVWQILLVVFLVSYLREAIFQLFQCNSSLFYLKVYSMLPLKTWKALSFGTLLSVLHLTVTAVFTTNRLNMHWQQVWFSLKLNSEPNCRLESLSIQNLEFWFIPMLFNRK